MKALLPLALVVLTATALVGCQNPEQKVIGTWLSSSGAELNVNADKTFTMSARGQQMKGTWTFQENKLNLAFTEIAGKTPEELQKQLDEADGAIAQLPGGAEAGERLMAFFNEVVDGVEFTYNEDSKILAANVVGQRMTLAKKEG